MFQNIYLVQLAPEAAMLQFAASTELTANNIDSKFVNAVASFMQLHFKSFDGAIFAINCKNPGNNDDCTIRAFLISQKCHRFWVPIKKDMIHILQESLADFDIQFYVSSDLDMNHLLLSVDANVIKSEKFTLVTDYLVETCQSYVPVSDAILLTQDILDAILGGNYE